MDKEILRRIERRLDELYHILDDQLYERYSVAELRKELSDIEDLRFLVSLAADDAEQGDKNV